MAGIRIFSSLLSRSKMEEVPESPKEDPQPERATQAGFAPRISEAMAAFLVNTVASTAKIVQAAVEAQKSAQLACFHAEQSLGQARLSYMAARGLAEQLLGFLNPPDYQGLFQHMSQPPIAYSEFCSIIRRTENALLHPVLKCKPGFPARRKASPGSERTSPPDNPEDGLQGGFRDLRSFRSPCVSETVETVLLEDQIGGTYVTHRRRSPRRSPSADISPLVSEQDLDTIQPLICSSRQGGSGKFLSKVTRRRKDQPQRENSDSDTDQLETSAKDAGQT
ncbi:hypothetical protein lerEdw1_009300 [Lerista edwardsae]|nr:hypothetical protein lerEdw1_009300 [Lerista edwardsae]